MPIEFLDILADDGWEPARNGVARSTRIDPSFRLNPVRMPPGWTSPPSLHDEQLLVQVFGGAIEIRYSATGSGNGASGDGDAPSVARVGPAGFAVIDLATPYVLVAGTEGATCLCSWPLGSTAAAPWSEDEREVVR